MTVASEFSANFDDDSIVDELLVQLPCLEGPDLGLHALEKSDCFVRGGGFCKDLSGHRGGCGEGNIARGNLRAGMSSSSWTGEMYERMDG